MELQKSDKAALEAAKTPYCRYDVFAIGSSGTVSPTTVRPPLALLNHLFHHHLNIHVPSAAYDI